MTRCDGGDGGEGGGLFLRLPSGCSEWYRSDVLLYKCSDGNIADVGGCLTAAVTEVSVAKPTENK